MQPTSSCLTAYGKSIGLREHRISPAPSCIGRHKMHERARTSPQVAPECLSDLLERRALTMAHDKILVGDMLELLGERSIEGMLLLLSLPMALPVPVPGLSVPFGASMMIVAAQLAVGRRHAWLPRILARRPLGAVAFGKLIEHAIPLLRRLERFVRPRGRWLAGRWVSLPVGLVCLVLALIIALPIPLGHVVPGTAISVLSLGLLERDGVALCVGLIISAGALLLVTFASAGAYGALSDWWRG
jgi:hypothetical protein